MSAKPGRPAVIVDPARHLGEPRIDGCRTPVRVIAAAVWDQGFTAAEAAAHFGIDRRHVLVACWYMTRWARTDNQRKTWRARWGEWVAVAEPELAREAWHRVADPWSPHRKNGTPEPEPAPALHLSGFVGYCPHPGVYRGEVCGHCGALVGLVRSEDIPAGQITNGPASCPSS